ncbi:trypsin-1-like [Condylostylus longicornis]|uniref:trypsin-1-like n=1 Tax=Condylostylus longicornis TaxID=2530218 RepID=UPI00244E218C|nr:trypsin-1-like [Condylostylus longicornis]
MSFITFIRILLTIILLTVSYGFKIPTELSKNSIQIDKLRIIGGTPVNIKDYKYLVSIQYRRSHICGGSIINEKTILSAAHCFSDSINNPDLIEIQAGSTYINWGWGYFFSNNNNNNVRINAENIIIHPEYNIPDLYDNDIALIVLKSNLIYSNKIGSINLPDVNDIFSPGTKVEVSGWGTTNQYFNMLSNVLKSVEIVIIDLETCNKLNYNEVNENNMLCAGDLNGGKDSCSGDSGGPLVTKRDNKTIIVGIVSWGYGCGYSSHPGVYTNVSKFLNWIKINSRY